MIKTKGFSLIEVLSVSVLVLIALGIFYRSTPLLSKIIQKYVYQTQFEESLTTFLIQFEKDFQSAEEIELIQDLIFRRDLNFDNIYGNSPTEIIRYRWNSKKLRIDRKSNRGNYQAFLEAIEYFEWLESPKNNNCFEMKLRTIFLKKNIVEIFCR